MTSFLLLTKHTVISLAVIAFTASVLNRVLQRTRAIFLV